MAEEKTPGQGSGEETPAGSGADLEGLIRNRDEILAEKRTLQEKLAGATAEAEALKTRLAKFEPAATEAETLRSKLAEAEKNAETLRERNRITQLSLALTTAGVRDPDYVQIARGAIKFSDEDKPEGVDEYVQTLKASKPWLFADVTRGGTVTTPPAGGGGGQKTITREELRRMSPAEYAAHRKEILAAKITE